MKNEDRIVVESAFGVLFGEAGKEYKAACVDEWRVRDRVKKAEEDIQERFRPIWIKVINIIRRECKKRGIMFAANSGCSRLGNIHVEEPGYDQVHAVGIGHIDYDTHPYISIDFWTSYGIELKWSGYAKTVEEFERNFEVLLATIDGYMKAACLRGRDCANCKLSEKDKNHCERCRVCVDGSLMI